ncbi:hypothetical protein BN997_01109 [Oceanobacillus oncorhynchi]|uniref:Uncharacterized protein n=1 Tax=Oceanobacillus oncorhynchi TaxID=545501 RepID=A0A0A1MQK8_9BACI|nr:hypothetical protein [Oceanobacillus oncorhynchi]CEI81291.1 hypothetical protein BN997_01109 [Oceanobacillus oncorhynchi]
MTWTNVFVETLKEWGEAIPEGTITSEDLAIYLGMTLGTGTGLDDPEGSIENLKDRIDYLVNEQSIVEQFLIESLLKFTSDYLESLNNNRGFRIISEENVIKTFEKNESEIPKAVKKTFEKAKSVEDYYKCEVVISQWEKIVANNFSRIKRTELVRKDMQSSMDRHDRFMDSLSEEDKDKTIGELRDKLKG